MPGLTRLRGARFAGWVLIVLLVLGGCDTGAPPLPPTAGADPPPRPPPPRGRGLTPTPGPNGVGGDGYAGE